MTDTTEQWQIGRTFNIKLEGGELVETKCTVWDCERRVFEATEQQGFIDLDWMDYCDQESLGRINLVGLPGYTAEEWAELS